MILRSKKYILVVCPVYEPYESGGAQSFPLIVEALSLKYRPIVLTEFNSQKNIIERKYNSLILRIMPIRDNFGKKTFLYSLFSFIFSYLIIYLVSITLAMLGIKVFHFTRYCSTFILPLLKLFLFLKIKIIYDCRTEVNNDQIKKFSKVFKYCNYLLANSEAALNSLEKYSSKEIPKRLIINPLKIKKVSNKSNFIIGNRKIVENQNIVCIGTISSRKASLKVVEAFLRATREISKNLKINDENLPKLLFAGRNDLGDKFISFINDFKNIHYIGSVSHQESLKLTKTSFGTINASLSEGIPRSCLESLFLKKPSLLPSCVPEFRHYCPEVCVSTNSKEDFLNLVELIKTMIINKEFILNKNSEYPINKHEYLLFKSEILNFYSYLFQDKY